MPLPFEEFQGKGVLDFTSVSSSSAAAAASDSFLSSPPQKWIHRHHNSKENCYVGSTEPTSVLDTRRSPSPPTSSSTLSSSHGSGASGGSTDTTTAAGVENPSQTPLEEQKCGPSLGMEDWESVLSESPGQEQSILRLIMSDIEDPSLGLNTLLQSSSGSDHHHQNLEFGCGGFQDVVDQGGGYGGGFEPDDHSGGLVSPSLHASSGPDFNFSNNASNVETQSSNVRPNPTMFSASMSNPFPVSLSSGMFQRQQNMGLEEKPQIFNPQMVINQNQAQSTQNPAMFMPLTYAQSQEHHLLSPPPGSSVPETECKELNFESLNNTSGVLEAVSLFPDFKDGSSDSDSSAILNEDNSPNLTVSSSGILQNHQLIKSPASTSLKFNCCSSSFSRHGLLGNVVV
ncbi:scarecrow-like protein 22 [Pyrus x bretschneideri]|uniref:scarecrow-like protein 22 n=1 Tax=Pyrus x bretschneideri TaxID=225117 RepID=UPI00202F73C7|nr:scarecrow-like protein 22 [Pyrus x bretschneideri]